MPENLRKKTVLGVSWNLAERFGVQAIQTVVLIILARILTPEDFGLIAIISVFFLIAQRLVDSGFGAAYVQKKEVSDIDASTLFYTNLLISIFIYLILYLSAPLISSFYEKPELEILTRVMGIIVIINAFNIIQISKLKRDLDFKRSFKITFASSILSGIAGIGSALLGFGVWALVIHQTLNRLFITTGMWISAKWMPMIKFSFTSFKEMFSFGSWVAFSSIIRKIFDNIYTLVIGKFYPASQVGFYSKAKSFQQLISKQLTTAIGYVSFPVFSKMQTNKNELRYAIQKFIRYTVLLTMPILVILIVVAEPLIYILLTDKWAEMIPYLQLLCFVGMIFPIYTINFQLINSLGQSRTFFIVDTFSNILRVVNIAVMFRYGIKYLIMGEIVVSLISLVFISYFTHKFVGYGFLKQVNDIKVIIISSLISGLAGYYILLSISGLWTTLILGVFSIAAIFFLLLFIIDREFFKEIISFKSLYFN